MDPATLLILGGLGTYTYLTQTTGGPQLKKPPATTDGLERETASRGIHAESWNRQADEQFRHGRVPVGYGTTVTDPSVHNLLGIERASYVHSQNISEQRTAYKFANNYTNTYTTKRFAIANPLTRELHCPGDLSGKSTTEFASYHFLPGNTTVAGWELTGRLQGALPSAYGPERDFEGRISQNAPGRPFRFEA